MSENDHRFYSHFNRSAFVHAEICRQEPEKDFKMIKLWAGKTEENKIVTSADHYLSYANARYLSFLILTFLEDGQSWTSNKGKVANSGKTVSRMMKINRNEDKYYLSIGVGPGIKEASGLIQPDRQAAKETWQIVTLVFTEEQIVTFALETVAYLNALVSKELLLLQ